jgi:4-amino-4-deoxy-L-arabinose transferase-like glycosyltransferase
LKTTETESTAGGRVFSRRSLASTTAILAYLAISDFVAHMAFATNYGYFRDELYYIVAGTQHLSLGYVDFPPMIAYIAALLDLTSQDSLVAIHVVPALAGALLVFVAGLIARELGGGRKAQVFAAAATLLALALLAEGSQFGPDALDQLWWSLLVYVLVRMIRRKEPKLWVVAGVVVGVGLLTKLAIFFFVAALLVSFLAVPSGRKYLGSRWVLVGGLIAVAFVLPMVYWNAVNGWPMVTFYQQFTGDFNGGGPLNFIVNQLGQLNYLDVPVVIAGVYFYLRSREAAEFRAFGIAFIVLFAFMTAVSFKAYYLAPVYPMMFAGGAILVERSSLSKKGVARWLGSGPYTQGWC